MLGVLANILVLCQGMEDVDSSNSLTNAIDCSYMFIVGKREQET